MSMSRLVLVVAASAVLVLNAGSALAHHSAAPFDQVKVVTLHGTIKEFQYTQPHSWIQLLVEDPDGKQVEWSVETPSPSVLMGAGIRKSSLPPGEKVTIQIHPLRDGRAGGLFISVVKSDGTVLTLQPPKP
jgi:hypothetical protein